tara:strand:+ start:22960 stop:23202 length:243 start_codon:yes stop_codon:yes gene_type:complete
MIKITKENGHKIKAGTFIYVHEPDQRAGQENEYVLALAKPHKVAGGVFFVKIYSFTGVYTFNEYAINTKFPFATFFFMDR